MLVPGFMLESWFVRVLHAACLSSALCSGGLAQLARALAWHARGHRFDPDILHPPHLWGIVL